MGSNYLGVAPLADAFTTSLTAFVNADGEIEFTGFYGDYMLTIDGQDYMISLVKGQSSAFLIPINPGDFDFDGDVDVADVDLLYDNFGANALYDLTGDDDADQQDVDYWVATIKGTSYGDADLDGDVDGVDFDAWRLRAGTGWANGDWDGDGDFDGADFDLWRTRPTAIGGGELAPVPEPATILLMVLAAPALGYARRRRLAR
jgi:hypothetical protein